MPELPDLEVFSKNLDKEFSGKTIQDVSVKVSTKLNVTEKELQKHLNKQVLSKIYRAGKELHLLFANKDILSLHLMLKGQLYIFNKTNDHSHTIIELSFTDGSGLCLTDYQSIAVPTLNPKESGAPDALSKDITTEFFKKALQKKTVIKKALMDQHIIRGIGNAYVDEILWHAGISPFSISSKIPETKIDGLIKAISSALKNAVKEIDKRNPGTISGESREFLDIHNSKKTHSPKGSPILTGTIASRITYYTNEQELFD